jgi:hypothetical protein
MLLAEEKRKPLQSKHKNRNTYLILIAVMVVTLGIPLYGWYQRYAEPASFVANDIHFVNDGTIEIQANITDTSVPVLMQVNAAIGESNDGMCSPSIGANQTRTCVFTNADSGSLLSCAQLPEAQNYTLTLTAFFANGKTLVHVYYPSYMSAQLGCG